MPQMSPMLWFKLMLYFIFTMIIIMTIFYNLIIYKNLNNEIIKFNKINFSNKW